MNIKITILIVFIIFINNINSLSLLNEFFDGKTYGKLPGPCPSISDPCVIDRDKLPQEILDTNFELGIAPDATLGEIFESFVFTFYEVECDYMEIGNVYVDNTVGTFDNTETQSKAGFTGLKPGCTFHLDFEDLRLGPGILDALVIGGSLDLKTVPANQGTGSDGAITLFVQQPDGFDTNIANNINIPDGTCETDINLAIEVIGEPVIDLGISGIALNVFQLAFPTWLNDIVELIVELVVQIVVVIVCEILQELDYLEDEYGNPTEDGFINKYFTQANDYVDAILLETDPDIDVAEANAIAGLSSDVIDNSWVLADSNLMQVVSVTINDWLGAESDSPGYEGDLIVNEAIDLLTQPTPGKIEFTQDSLSDIIPVLTFTTPPAIIEIELVGFALDGLNSITAFSALNNNYDLPLEQRRDYTLTAHVEIGSIIPQIGMRITFIDGDWVTVGKKTQRIDFDFETTISDIVFDMALLFIITPDDLTSLTFGQLIGESINGGILDKLLSSLNCISPAIHHLEISSFATSIGEIADVTLSNIEDADFEKMFNDGAVLLMHVMKGGFQVALPAIIQHEIRPAMNDIIYDEVVTNTANCPAPQPAPVDTSNDYYELGDVINLVKPLVNKVVGGDPVINTAADINELIQVLLESFIFEPLTEEGNYGIGTVTSPEDGDWVIDLDATLTKDDFQLDIKEFSILGLNTICGLTIDGVNDYKIEVFVNLFDCLMATAANPTVASDQQDPLKVSSLIEMTNGDDIDDEFEIYIELSDVDINTIAEILLNEEKLLALSIQQLSKPRCILAVLDGFTLEPFTLAVGNSQVKIDIKKSGTADISNKLIAWETAVNSGDQTKLGSMVDYFVQSFVNFIVGRINDYDHTQETEIGLDECDSNPLINPEFTKYYDNITDFFNKNLGAQVEYLTVTEATDNVQVTNDFYFDWYTSTVGNIPKNVLEVLSIADYQLILDELAESEGDIISDLFTVDEFDKVSMKIPIADWFGAFSLDFVIEGATIAIDHIKFNAFDTFDFANLKLFYPLSKFVTQHYLKFSDTSSFEVQLTLQVPEVFLDRTASDTILVTDTMLLEIQADNVEIDIDTVLAFNLEVLTEQTLGHYIAVDEQQQFYSLHDTLDCFFSNFYEDGLLVSKFLVNFQNAVLSFTSTENVVSQPVAELFQAVVELVINDLYVDDIELLFQGFIRNFINDVLIRILRDLGDDVCYDPPALPAIVDVGGELEYIDWTITNFNTLIKQVNNILYGVNEDYSPINNILSSFSGQKYLDDAPLILEDELFVPKLDEKLGDFYFKLSNIHLKQLGNVEELALMLPLDKDTVALNVTLDQDIEFSFDMHFIIGEFFTEDFTLDNELQVNVLISDFRFALELFNQVNIPKMLQQLRFNFLTKQEFSCAIGAIDSLQIEDAFFYLNKISLSLSCIGTCNSPQFAGLQQGQDIVVELSTADAQDQASTAVNYVQIFLNVAESYFESDGFNNLINDYVSNDNSTCKTFEGIGNLLKEFINPPPQQQEFVSSQMGFGFMGVCLGSLFFVFGLVPRHRRKKQLMMDECKGDPNKLELVHLQTASFFQHPRIPTPMKYGLVITFVVSTILLVLSWVAMPLVTGEFYVFILGSTSKRIKGIEFTVGKFLDDSWSSGGYLVAIMLALGASAYPVIKNLMVLFAFLAPTTVLSDKRRFLLVDILDMLGRWSFLDVFILVTLTGILNIYVDVAYNGWLDWLPDRAGALEVHFVPQAGYVVLTLSAFIALLATNVVLYYNNKIREYNEERILVLSNRQKENDKELNELRSLKISLANHNFTSYEPNIPKFTKYSAKVKFLFKFIIAFTILFLFGAIFVPVVTFNYNGGLGLALQVIDPALATSTQSYATLAKAMTDARKVNSEVGDLVANSGYLLYQLLYVLCVLIAPFVQICAYGILFYYPMNLDEQKLMKQISAIGGSWACMEVFFIAIGAGLLQGEQIAEYIIDFVVGGRCSVAAGVLDSMFGATNAGCVKLDAYFTPESIIMLLAILCYLVLMTVMQRLCGMAMKDRMFTTKDEYLKYDHEKGGQRIIISYGWVEKLVSKFAFATSVGSSGNGKFKNLESNEPHQLGMHHQQQLPPLVNDPSLYKLAPPSNTIEV